MTYELTESKEKTYNREADIIISFFKAFCLWVGLSSTILLTYFMFTVSFMGVTEWILSEPNKFISIAETIFGIIAIPCLFYLLVREILKMVEKK